jgi:hypothetical protein
MNIQELGEEEEEEESLLLLPGSKNRSTRNIKIKIPRHTDLIFKEQVKVK